MEALRSTPVPERPELSPDRAFVHVINDHRWLAASACSWRNFKASASVRASIHPQLANIDVSLSAGVLVYSRSLVEFYTRTRDDRDDRVRPTDIVIRDFDIVPTSSTESGLRLYRRSIERHLLHLTAYRDADYRKAAEDAGDEAAQRIDWDREYLAIVRAIFTALAETARAKSAWAPAFEELRQATEQRLADSTSQWPDRLQPDHLGWLPSC